jgi:hypothetical protein
MSLVQGSQSLASGVDTASVVYPSAFAATPEVILVTVDNTSGDAVKLAICATITASSTTGFTVGLSQPTNTSNYNLVWYVSDTGTITDPGQLDLKGRRVSDLNVLNVVGDDDYFPVVKAYPTPHTKRVKWSRLKTAFLQAVNPLLDSSITVGATAPTSSADVGEPGTVLQSGNYLYVCIAEDSWLRAALVEF